MSRANARGGSKSEPLHLRKAKSGLGRGRMRARQATQAHLGRSIVHAQAAPIVHTPRVQAMLTRRAELQILHLPEGSKVTQRMIQRFYALESTLATTPGIRTLNRAHSIQTRPIEQNRNLKVQERIGPNQWRTRKGEV